MTQKTVVLSNRAKVEYHLADNDGCVWIQGGWFNQQAFQELTRLLFPETNIYHLDPDMVLP